MTHDYIKKSALGLVRRVGTRDPFAICRECGIHIKQADLGSLKGMYSYIKKNRFIVLNEKMSTRMKAIVCAHELGHDSLHRELAKDKFLQEFMLYKMDSRPEYEANIFASYVLLDDDELYDYAKQGYDAAQIAKLMHTDVNLVLIKINEMIGAGYEFNSADLPKSSFLRD